MVGHKYTEEEHEFLHSFIPGHTYKEIVAEWNKTFAEPITVSRVKGYMANHKIKNGLTGQFKKGNVPYNKGKHIPTVGRMGETQFKKGNLPHNTKPVGTERITRDGYIEVKIKMRPNKNGDNWKPKHRIVWEEAYGPIPKGHKLLFLDGNRQNCCIDNLRIVTDEEELAFNRIKVETNAAELTDLKITLAKVSTRTHKAKRKCKGLLKEGEGFG